MREITETHPLEYRGFLIYDDPNYDGLPGPQKLMWIIKDYDGDSRDCGGADTIEDAMERIDMRRECEPLGEAGYDDSRGPQDAWYHAHEAQKLK